MSFARQFARPAVAAAAAAIHSAPRVPTHLGVVTAAASVSSRATAAASVASTASLALPSRAMHSPSGGNDRLAALKAKLKDALVAQALAANATDQALSEWFHIGGDLQIQIYEMAKSELAAAKRHAQACQRQLDKHSSESPLDAQNSKTVALPSTDATRAAQLAKDAEIANRKKTEAEHGLLKAQRELRGAEERLAKIERSRIQASVATASCSQSSQPSPAASSARPADPGNIVGCFSTVPDSSGSDDALKAAQDKVAKAEQRLANAQKKLHHHPSVEIVKVALRNAETALADAQQELADLEASIAMCLPTPLDSQVFIPLFELDQQIHAARSSGNVNELRDLLAQKISRFNSSIRKAQEHQGFYEAQQQKAHQDFVHGNSLRDHRHSTGHGHDDDSAQIMKAKRDILELQPQLEATQAELDALPASASN